MRERMGHWVVPAILLAVSSGGCGSGDDDPGTNKGGSGTDDRATLSIYFPKLYSAFIEGSAQEFQVPAVVAGVRPDSWECSDPDAVTINTDEIPNGAMFSVRKAGTFKITARSGKQYGEAELVVTEATEEQLAAGEKRYNNAVALDLMGLNPRTTNGMPVMQNASCKNCHGSGAMALAVEHTPQQTGGYSDEEIRAIFSMGMKPPGAPFGSFPGIAMFYPVFHRWAATEEEYQGLVVYLRSLKPMSQGTLDFQGLIAAARRGMMSTAGTTAAAAGSGAAGAEADAAGTSGAAAGANAPDEAGAGAAGSGGDAASAAGSGGDAASAAGASGSAAGASGEGAAAGTSAAAGAGGDAAGTSGAGAGGETAGAGGT